MKKLHFLACLAGLFLLPSAGTAQTGLHCPANVTVTCEDFSPSLSVYGLAEPDSGACINSLTETPDWSQFDSLCHRGSITRFFEAKDCQNNTSTCSQKIVVQYNQHYFIRFPDDVFTTNCPQTPSFGEPLVLGNDCELLQITFEDQQINPVPDACIKIVRNWSVINWCTFNPALPLVFVPNPNPNPILGHPSNLPGPIVSACNAPAPWAPTLVKVGPADPDSTNFCTYWSPTANGYWYTQSIRIIDVEGPEIANCPAASGYYADSTQNDPALWHNVFDPSQPSADLTEVETDLSISSSDVCLNGYTSTQFFLLLDLDNNGTQETVVNATPQANADTIRFNNIGTPGFLGGTATTFDTRQVPTNQKWHFTLQNTLSAGTTVSALRWNTAQQPNVYVMPDLPQGTHKIKWIVGDNCGNSTVCEHTFTVQQGLSTSTENPDQYGFALFQNEPNPFNRHTSIGFRLAEAGEAVLEVFDAAGRRVYQKKGYFTQGFNQITLDGEWLSTPGVLYYKLESGADTAWRKMIATRL